MKKLLDFNDFLFDELVEAVKVTELELILSEKMKVILNDMNHVIATDLLALHKESEPVFQKTFIDLDPEPGWVTFIQSNKVADHIEPEIVHGTYQRNTDFKLPPRGDQEDNREEDEKSMGEFDILDGADIKNPWIQDINHILDLHEIQFTDKNHPVWTKNRGRQRVGRLIGQLFPGKYPPNPPKREDWLDIPNDIETFGNQFKAVVESRSKMIVEVKGEDIIHYYNCENYFKSTGTLGGSCMRGENQAKQLGIYSDNPNRVSMLILYPEDIRDKIIGRAILWKLDKINGEDVEGDKYFMDRIYTASDSDEYMYIEYAKSKGYYYKSNQTYGYNYEIIHPNGDKLFTDLEVQVGAVEYDLYPYCDTMQFYNPDTGWVSNILSDYEDNDYGGMYDMGGSISFRHD